MAVAGLYRRLLPAPSIDFTCHEGKDIFKEALEAGTMEGFFKLIANFQTQAEPAYCGLASLSVVLNALSVDPGRPWKGPWRWFDETMLDCCEPLEKVKAQGISFAKVVCLGECSGARVEAWRADKSNIEEFRQLVKECCASEDHHMIASYNRQLLKQTGTGHFSPLGGYHEQRDMALILDVARFKYPPHWVPLDVLWDAINTIDVSTGKSRGFMIVTKRYQPSSLLFTSSCKVENWRDVSKYLSEDIIKVIEEADITNLEDVFSAVLTSFPGTIAGFVKWIAEVRRSSNGSKLDKEESQRLKYKAALLNELRSTDLHKRLSEWLKTHTTWALSGNSSLTQEVDEACCQGAVLLSGGVYGTRTLDCTSLNSVRMQVAQGGVVVGEQDGVQVLVPTGSCQLHPTATDLFAILLFAQPFETWSEIQNVDVKSAFTRLVSTEELPESLQMEIQHLQRQLRVLNCSED